MEQEFRDKIFQVVKKTKDTLVNAGFDKASSLADKAAKDERYSAEQRKRAKEFGEEARTRKAEYNSLNGMGALDYEEYTGTYFGEESASFVKEYTEKPISNTNRSTTAKRPNKPKKSSCQWTHGMYLNQLRVTFKNGLATKSEIRNFILSKGLGVYGITIGDVQKDLQENGIAKIVTEKVKEARLQEERKARIPKVETPKRTGAESYMQVNLINSMDDENADFFCT